MTYLKKILLAASLAVASLSANALIITQQLELAGFGNIGFVTVEFDNTELADARIAADADPFLDARVDTYEVLDMAFFGLSFAFLDVTDFEASVDADDLWVGLNFVYADLTDVGFADTWAYQFEFSTFDPANNSLDIFDITNLPNPSLLAFFNGEDLSLANATFIPEPSTLSLFGLALLAMGARRRFK